MTLYTSVGPLRRPCGGHLGLHMPAPVLCADGAVKTLAHAGGKSNAEKAQAAQMALAYLRNHRRCRPVPREAPGCQKKGGAQ